MSGVNALYENDLKKVIALSTLRQLSLIIIILRLGLDLLGFYHLIIAVFNNAVFHFCYFCVQVLLFI